MTQFDPPIQNEQLHTANASQSMAGAQRDSVALNESGATILSELATTTLLVVVFDLLIFQHGGATAWAAAFIANAALLVIAKFRRANKSATFLFSALLLGIAAQLWWSGDVLRICVGVFVSGCLVMATSGLKPLLPEAFAFFPVMLVGASKRMFSYLTSGRNVAHVASRPLGGLAALLLPLLVCSIFIGCFVMANPDVLLRLSEVFSTMFATVFRQMMTLSIPQVLFWFVASAIVLGGLHPILFRMMAEEPIVFSAEERQPVSWFRSYQNTLVSVIVVFVVYLIFEFATLWFRELPRDFYYAGYAHQGAAWLTVALAFSTLLLSYFFRSATLRDPRIGRLKNFVLAWSALNLLLTLAVFNRMWIYIDYNGLTEMRVIGILGISAVAIGFVLVVLKVQFDHGFRWLIHRQLWAPAAAIVAFAILPVDWIVSRYNVARVETGSLPPVVQLVAQPYEAGGALPLVALIDHPQLEVRDGVRALLAQWALRLQVTKGPLSVSADAWTSPLGHRTPWTGKDSPNRPDGRRAGRRVSDRLLARWEVLGISSDEPSPLEPLYAALDRQGAEDALRRRLASETEKLEPFVQSAELRNAAINDFFEFAYRWY